MSKKISHLIPALAVVAAAIFLVPCAVAQAPTLTEQLEAQYKYVKMGSDTSGPSVVEKGALLAIQKGGILGVPYSDSSLMTTTYENGQVHTPGTAKKVLRGSLMSRFGKEQTTHLFAVGDKVYPSKIDVKPDKDTVTLTIVACDTCNKTDPPTYNKANVVFQFPKGTLAAATAGQVEDTIGQLLAVSSEDSGQGGDQAQQQGGDQGAQQGGGQQGGGQQGGGGQPGGQDQAQQPAADQAAAQPQSIEKGMTPDQVEAAIGQPDKKVNLGSKQIYVYKDLKVTFLNGKVSDVQ
jgi:hypothetical protein